MAMYERFNIYVSEKTLFKLRDLFASHRKDWLEDQHENGELICLWGEFESRVQHLHAELRTRGRQNVAAVKAEKVISEDWLT